MSLLRKPLWWRLGVLVNVLLLLAFSTETALPQNTPTHADLPYIDNSNPRHLLDVYLPAAASPPYPTLLMMHGGGFQFGSKAMLDWVATHFAGQGYAVVVPNYRLSASGGYPNQVNDAFCALAWVHANAATYQFDMSRLAAVGESAGGFLVAMLAAADNPAAFLSGCPHGLPGGTQLRGIVAYYPITGASVDEYPVLLNTFMYPFVNLSSDIHTQAELSAAVRAVAPTNSINGNEPPFLFIHAGGDAVVPVGDSQRVAEALQAAGVRAEQLILPGSTHGFIGVLNTPESQQALPVIMTFLRSLGM